MYCHKDGDKNNLEEKAKLEEWRALRKEQDKAYEECLMIDQQKVFYAQ